MTTWGATNSYGLGSIPSGLTNVVGLCAGANHSVALKANGQVVAWGYNFWGQTNVPTSATNVIAIAAALNHTLALRSNGTVVSWGDITNVPPNVSDAVAIAAGDNHNIVLRANGTVAVWGTTSAGTATNVPAGLSNVVAVAGGGNFSAAIQSDGRVVRWGGTISTTGMTNIASLAGGVFTLVALKADGKVVAPSTGTVPASLSNVVAVAAGRYHGLALKSDTTVTNWTVSPATPAGLSNLTLIASGENHCLGLIGAGAPLLTTPMFNRTVAPGSTVPFHALATGTLPMAYQWQRNGTNIPGATSPIYAPTNVIPSDSGDYAVTVSNSYGAITSSVAVLTVTDFGPALNTSNLVWTSGGDAPWLVQTTNTHDGVSALQSGSISGGQSSVLRTTVTGPGTLTFWWRVANAQIVFQGGSGASAGVSGTANWQQQTVYLGTGSRTLTWTLTTSSGTGWLDEVTFEPGATAPIFSSPPAGQSQGPGFGVTLSGGATGTPPIGYQWQFNGADLPGATGGSLGIASLHPTNTGIYTLVATNLAGTNHADASAEIGQVAAWPMPNSIQTIIPAGMTNIVAIAQGMQHSLVLRADGTVQGWDTMPVPAGLSNIIAISSSAGAYHDMALKSDGTVVAWGDTTWGGTWGQTNVPAGLSNVVAIAAGWYHCMALKADGTVVAWGDVSEGQANVPEGLTNVVAIGAGSFHSLAVLDNGNVVAWGRPTTVPPDLTNAVAVAAGLFYCTAVTVDGRVVTWGDNAYGQTNVPMTLTNATSISAGWYHAIAATSDGHLAPCDNSSTVPAGVSNVIAVATGYYNNLALLDGGQVTSMTSLTPTLDANSFRVALGTRSGRVYRLEYKNSLDETAWTPFPLRPGNGGIQTLTDPTGISSQRFYRVREW